MASSIEDNAVRWKIRQGCLPEYQCASTLGRGKYMATILVDYENVVASNGLKGVDALRADDTLIVFYSDSCRKIRHDYMQSINDSGCEFRIVKLKNQGKDALDFYIAAECGMLGAQGEKQMAIISNDKGFQAVLDYFTVNDPTSEIQLVKAGNIESAFIMLDAPENADRRTELKMRSTMLDLAAEYARIEERNDMRNRLKEVLHGTGYENRISEIIDFIENKKADSRKNLYTGSLQSFGRCAGTDIYRIVKQIM